MTSNTVEFEMVAIVPNEKGGNLLNKYQPAPHRAVRKKKKSSLNIKLSVLINN